MSRRPAVFLVAMTVLLGGCGGHRDEAPAQSSAASSKPVDPPPAQAATTDGASAEAPAAAAPVVATTTTTTAVASTTKAATDPPFTPGTSLPGAIPPSPLPADAKPADKPADPLEWLQTRQSRQADYTKRVGEAEANLAVANASVADWERTILAFKNPFRPRPQLSPEDAQAIEGKDGVARVAWAEGKLAAATAVRDAAQKTLDDLKANPGSN